MLNFKKTYLNGFTLVELIVVIVILAILATIAFLSFNSYSSSSRDSVRLSDITNISKWVELYFTKIWTYPTPINSTIYTWWINWWNIINQWNINWNNIWLSKSNPTDPLTNNLYTYSVWWNNSYYQIYWELENWTSYLDNNSAYADNKLSYIKWNYLPDPSLPSLIIVPSSVPTTSWSWWIFSPNVCFITSWNSASGNLLSSSTSSNCIKKYSINLNSLDNFLVWYWDMESCNPNCTTSWAKLNDLSWNNNSWTIFWNNIISTWSILWKWLSFSWDTASYVEINKDTWSILNNEEITVVTNFNATNTAYRWWIIWDTYVCNWTNRCSNFQIGTTPNSFNPSFFMVSAYNNDVVNLLKLNYVMDFDKKFTNLVFTRKSWKTTMYINWIKWIEQSYDQNLFYPNNKPYRLGISMFSPANIRLFWILDDLKIYKRVLSDQEIKQQAKIAWF